MKFIPILLSLVVVSLISLFFTSFSQEVEKKDQMDRIARKTILSMETVGYLTEESQMILLQELQKIGIKDIDLGGTTTTYREYGNPICLEIQGNISISEYDLLSLFDVKKKNMNVPVHLYRETTAKN